MDGKIANSRYDNDTARVMVSKIMNIINNRNHLGNMTDTIYSFGV